MRDTRSEVALGRAVTGRAAKRRSRPGDAYPPSLRTPIRLSGASEDLGGVMMEIHAARDHKLRELADWFEAELTDPDDLLRIISGLAVTFLPGFQVENGRRPGRPRSSISDEELVATVAEAIAQTGKSEREVVAELYRQRRFPSAHSAEALRKQHQRAKARLMRLSRSGGT